MKKPLVLLLIIALTLACAACANKGGKTEQPTPTPADSQPAATPGDSGESGDGGAGEADMEWISLDVPAGFEAVRESSQYFTVQNTADKKQFVRIAYDYLMGRELDRIVAEQVSDSPGKYSKGADAAFSGFFWQVVNYQDNGADCRMLFALAGDGDHFLRVTAIGLTENDFALQVILGNLRIDASKL